MRVSTSHVMELSLRRTSEEDYDFLRWLHRVTMKPYVEQIWGWNEDVQKRYFDEHHFRPDVLKVVERDGEAVGCIAVEQRDEEIYLSSLEVVPRHQNQGVGTQLINQVLEEADEEGLPVKLQVLKFNPARRLYERMGFRKVEETETHFLMQKTPEQ